MNSDQDTAGKTAITELHFLPSAAWFALISGYSEVVLDVHENYVKQSYRNRSIINTANGPEALVVPVLHTGDKQPVNMVKIDNSGNWNIRIWRSLQAAYGRSPYYLYYADELKQILLDAPDNLAELNACLLTFCLKAFGIKTKMNFSTAFVSASEAAENKLADRRGILHPKKQALQLPFIPYKQVFGKEFVPGTGAADLLFCLGPDSGKLIAHTAEANRNSGLLHT
ncbi:MAG: WbqC family protein [Bacteroidota bacterium]